MIAIDKLVRSKRKTLALIVEPDGTLTVRAPQRMKRDDIRRFIEAKEDWIRRKQAEARESAPPPRRYVEGETFWYLGREVPLRILTDGDSSVGNGRPALMFDGSFKLAESAGAQAEAVFTAWYRAQARKVLTDRVEFFSSAYGLQAGRVRISSARTRWGSCSSKETLSFTWRLVMAPLEVVDYVVVHELCHLEEMNHSRAFWAKVGEILPDYRARRKWLKDNGAKLRL